MNFKKKCRINTTFNKLFFMQSIKEQEVDLKIQQIDLYIKIIKANICAKQKSLAALETQSDVKFYKYYDDLPGPKVPPLAPGAGRNNILGFNPIMNASELLAEILALSYLHYHAVNKLLQGIGGMGRDGEMVNYVSKEAASADQMVKKAEEMSIQMDICFMDACTTKSDLVQCTCSEMKHRAQTIIGKMKSVQDNIPLSL